MPSSRPCLYIEEKPLPCHCYVEYQFTCVIRRMVEQTLISVGSQGTWGSLGIDLRDCECKIYLSVKSSKVAISILLGRQRYLLKWNSFSSSRSCVFVYAVRSRRDVPGGLTPEMLYSRQSSHLFVVCCIYNQGRLRDEKLKLYLLSIFSLLVNKSFTRRCVSARTSYPGCSRVMRV